MRPLWTALPVITLVLACESGIEPYPLDSPFARPVHRIEVPSEVDLGARSEWNHHDSINMVLTANNPTSDTLHLYTGICLFRVRAYRTADLQEPAFWEALYSQPRLCTDAGIIYELPPGDSDVVSRVYRRREMAMGFPDEPGHFGLVVVHNDVLRVLPAGGFRPR